MTAACAPATALLAAVVMLPQIPATPPIVVKLVIMAGTEVRSPRAPESRLEKPAIGAARPGAIVPRTADNAPAASVAEDSAPVAATPVLEA